MSVELSLCDIDDASLLGSGSRRRCYQVPDEHYCVKFYHLNATLPNRTRLKNRYAIALARHWRAYNINYREWRYHQKLSKRLPADVLAIFPEHTKPVYSKEHGWGIVESLIKNCDGSLSLQVLAELKNSSNTEMSYRIFKAAEVLIDQLIEHSISYFDHGNIMVQWLDEKRDFRLRVADFEPTCRALVPELNHIRFYVRCKIRRRGSRYLKNLAAIINADANRSQPCIISALSEPTLWQRFKMAAGLEMWRGRTIELTPMPVANRQ